MSVPAHTIQGTPDWLEYRKSRGGASEVAALMGCSPWFPRTPYQLFQAKTGQAEVHEHAAMRRGTELEHAARDYLEDVLEEVFETQVVELKRMVASLDGLSFDGKTVLEIKIPASGCESDTWQYVQQHGKPPAHYAIQVQQQLLCSGAEMCIFAVCAAEEDVITDYIHCVVTPDPAAHEDIRAAWADFFQYLDSGQPPPMTEQDVIERSDPDWSAAAQAYRIAKAALKNAESAEKAARERLQALAGEQSTKGCGVSATRFWRSGGTDWRRAAITAGSDGVGFEKKGSYQWRISEAK